MPDILEINEALVQLQQELETLGSATKKVDEAKEKIEKSLKSWKEQHGKDKELLDQTSEALTNSLGKLNEFSETSQETSQKLIALAKSIDNVNFPNRLDKLDNITSLLASQTANLQSNIEREYNLLSQLDTRFSAKLEDVQKRVKGTRLLLWTFGFLITIGVTTSVILLILMHS